MESLPVELLREVIGYFDRITRFVARCTCRSLRKLCGNMCVYPNNPPLTIFLIKKGNLSLLKWFKEHGCPWNKYNKEYAQAIEYGYTDIAEWLVEQGKVWDATTYYEAIDSGHASDGRIEWLIEKCCPMDIRCHVYAVYHGGRKDMMEIMHKHGLELHIFLCTLAASSGHEDSMNWLLKNGCPMDDATVMTTINSSAIGVLREIAKSGRPFDVAAALIHLDAARKNGTITHNSWKSMHKDLDSLIKK